MKVKTILVVDNNVTIVELISNLLTTSGFQVMKAYDGIDALDKLEGSETLPDAILLDLVMPKIDGQRLTRILRTDERYAGIPIIILTGIAAEEDGKLLEFGADAYIAKGKIEETFRHIQDTIKWLEERPAPDTRSDKVLGIEALYPREMTKELLLVKEHFDSMFDLMEEGVIEIDQDHRILFANPAAQRFLCQEDHLLFGRQVADLFQETPELEEYLLSVRNSKTEPHKTIRMTCSGIVCRAIASPFFLDGRYIGAVIILQDITSLVHRERSLEDLMAAIVRNAPVGLSLLDGEGNTLVSNPALTRILQQPPEWNSVGINLVDFLAELSPPLNEALKRLLHLEPGKTLAHKADYFPKGATVRQVLNLTGTALDIVGENRFLLLMEDVTEKSLLEENLRRVNEEMERANKSKSTFLSMVSHELRTPLSVVRGYLSLILEGKIGPDAEKVKEALKVADKRARHLQHLIEELLDLSRIEAGKLSIKTETLDARKHIVETVDMFRDDHEQKGLTVDVDIPDDLPPVYADHDKVHQIFTNLISNAIKFSNYGGRVAITARSDGRQAEFKVSDSGIGIPADRIDRIFEKFYQVDSSDTRKHAGTGLGLSIVKMIIDALGGTIHVTSEIGRGTSFGFTLPLSEEGPAPAVASAYQEIAAAAPESAGNGRKRVLVVEDDPDTLELIRLFLADQPYDVHVATDAFEGLREFFRKSPDLVVADALMPLMTGLDLCRIIKNHPDAGDLPVVILSAAAQEDEIRGGYEVGASSYLVKPFTSQDLLDTIRKHTS